MVTAPTPWQGGLVAISSFGFGGSNVHCLVAGAVRPAGPPPRALPAPPALEAGETRVEDVTESEPQLFPSEVCAALSCNIYRYSMGLMPLHNVMPLFERNHTFVTQPAIIIIAGLSATRSWSLIELPSCVHSNSP